MPRRRCRRFTGLVAGLLAAAVAGPLQAAPLRATLLLPADDPRLDRTRLERGDLGHPGGPATAGLRLGLEDSRFELEAARTGVTLEAVPVASADSARSAAQSAAAQGADALVVDLPGAWALAAADAVTLPVLNVGDAADRLRAQDCRARLFHLLPSERMRADALAQALASRGWRRVLLLLGADGADAGRADTAQASIRRHGLQIAATRRFKRSADPREREQANPLLLTAGVEHDAVWVVDGDGEFARSLPYRTALPRPVVGDAGLVALAWHARFERYGAPQLSRRFQRAAQRPMTGHDWAAWMAGRVLAAAAVARTAEPAAKGMPGLAGATFDGSKGIPLSFRAWDGQLRQPMLLTDGQAVIGLAPVDGVLHPTHALDTLGADAPEKLCKSPR